MKSILYLLSLCLLGVFPASIYSQEKNAKTDPFQNAFANPVDKAGLPRVLIIGDSISIGYTPRVRKLLDGVANVHRAKTNCRWSAFGVENIDTWLGDSKWDIIHFNFGLWDWYGWKQEIKATPESYAKNLETVITKIKAKSDAKLIFAITTPPCVKEEKNAKFIVTDKRARQFNKAALNVMNKHGVMINDLYDVIWEDRDKYQKGPDDVHYNDAGRDLLASKVSARIKSVQSSATQEVSTD